MTRLRIMGPEALLRDALAGLQDLGVFHPAEPSRADLSSMRPPDALARRRRRNLERAIGDVEAAIEGLEALGTRVPGATGAEGIHDATAACVAGRTRRRVQELLARERTLAAERDTLAIYIPLFRDLESLYARGRTPHRFSAYLLMLRESAAVDRFRRALDEALEGAYDLRTRQLDSGNTALLLLVPASQVERVDELLREARVESMPVPSTLGGGAMLDALPRMRPRLAEIDRELAELRRDAAALARESGSLLTRARFAFHDELRGLEAEDLAGHTGRAFVLEGWVPAAERPRVERRMHLSSPAMSVYEVAREEWAGELAPVVLTNPRIFEPFERLTALLPLPRYGSVDPTPFVAIFFPMLFGLVVGDVAYGLAIGLLSGIVWLRSRPGGIVRDVGKIAGACATYTVIFGFLYGELLGDLGHRWLGLEPLLFDREETLVPFLAGAIALGGVHLLIGLVIGAFSAGRTEPRKAAGRGVTALMLVLIAVALLTVFELLPAAFFTPAIVALLVAFPILIVLEGFTAPIELMSLIGHVLSYARVMALGTASVVLAVVANRMVGALGSVAIGVLFALLFHLVNFAIALFSPTIHVLRLHYVEFFGTFYSPGGARYHPLTHWSPAREPGS